MLQRSRGAVDLALGAPVTNSTRFLIASITKPVTALAIQHLATAGRLDLDAPVQSVVPEFRAKPGAPITARLLLDHRGGIRHYRPGETSDDGFFDRHYSTAVGITIWPEQDLVVVALSNTGGIDSRLGGFTPAMHRAIADVIFR